MANDPGEPGAGLPVELSVTFDVAQGRGRIDLDYRVVNSGASAVVLHNRGSAVGSRLQSDRTLPMLDPDGGLTVEAMPVSSPFADGRRTGPTVPPVSLAMALAPGAAYQGKLTVNPPEGARRIRFCLGVSPFDPEAFTGFEAVPVAEDGVALLRSPWRENLSALQVLCSDWQSLDD